MSITLAMIFSVLSTSAGFQSSRSAPTDSPRPDELVKQLADPQFKVREAADRSLAQLGLAALDALREGEKHADLEVRERCRRLLSTIRRLDLQRRIDSLSAVPNDLLPNDLPFVATFLKIAGDSKEARGLYAEIFRSNPQLLDEAERDRKRGAEFFVVFCDMIRFVKSQNLGDATTAEVALFLLLTNEFADADNQFLRIGHYFLQSRNLKEELEKDTNSLPLKRLFVNWLEKRPMQSLLPQALQLAADVKLKEALPLILKYSKHNDIPAETRFQIIPLLVKVGATADHLKEIEPLLNDKTIGRSPLGQPASQMRDIALWVCVQLSGEKLEDYGFDYGVSFRSDESREAAFKKYKMKTSGKKE